MTTPLVGLTYCYFHCCLHSGAPQITVSASTYVIQGDTLTVNCSVTSFPQSSVSLSFGGTPIVTTVSEVCDPTAGSFSYFTTHSTTAIHPSDEGNYTCSANITHGQPAMPEVFSDTAFVTVYGESCSHAHWSMGGWCVVGTHTPRATHTLSSVQMLSMLSYYTHRAGNCNVLMTVTLTVNLAPSSTPCTLSQCVQLSLCQ